MMAGLVVAALCAAASPLPGTWMASAESPTTIPTPGALGGVWDAITLWLPVGERGARAGFAALLRALAGAASAAALAFSLYQGTGRRTASFVVVPVCATMLLAWLRTPGASAQLPKALACFLLAMLAVELLLGLQRRLNGSSRSHGCGLVVAIALTCLWVHRSGAAPMLLVMLSIAVCGWIGLAGSIFGRWAARAAALAILGVAALPALLAPGPIATTRPEASLLALHQRGLVAPGDVLLAHDPWLALAFAAAQRDEGVRPDVELYAASSLPPARLDERLARWSRSGRRVLSDSFSQIGRWAPESLLDSGPLFWFVAVPGANERSFIDLRAFSPRPGEGLPIDEAARWERLHVERARHRRALGQHEQAMLALPFADDELSMLTQRLRLALLSRLPSNGGSELEPTAWPLTPTPASARAEAGDLLLALGDGATGAEQLAEAADSGVVGALAALVRWHLRAGEQTAADATLQALVAAPALRLQLLAVGRWLLLRARPQQAAALLAAAPSGSSFAPEELALRLATLRGLATP